jgi:hypothetical protein
MSPSEDVLHSLAVGLTDDPKFQVLGPVVQAISVDVGNILPREQLASELFLHDVTMLENPAPIVQANRPVSAGMDASAWEVALPLTPRRSFAWSCFDRSPPALLDQVWTTAAGGSLSRSSAALD